jgi:transcriptional regulator with XRE-family HTH domain
MQIGVRIEERLKALGLSQAELARRTNIPQTTINGLVRGSSRSSPHLVKIARELQTTPAYLTGEVDDPAAEFPEFPLTSPERQWVELLRGMDSETRSAMLRISKCLIQSR